MMMDKCLKTEWNGEYYEVQRFNRTLNIFIVGILLLTSWYSFYIQIIAKIPFGNNPAPDYIVILIAVIFGILFPAFFIVLKLEINVNDNCLRFRFYPIHIKWKEIALSEISAAEEVKFRPIMEYGGWGIRFRRGIKAYIMKGNEGVMLTFADGKQILLGSQKTGMLLEAMRKK
ncbi:hypothetical protein [Methanoplanus endosymbiosus]|uniref:Uncharacterized protein n=1 Tax=Methanoplanus endosymbiosus TaxID=33865 RepID=A0A9E7TJW0_9EURY|nr:hypothetical protein [Methanoplanus endosymbiosus]UUX92130.1 hypothetical protein L6E24_12325 [Methanoplanus endosymbiosus]